MLGGEGGELHSDFVPAVGIFPATNDLAFELPVGQRAAAKERTQRYWAVFMGWATESQARTGNAVRGNLYMRGLGWQFTRRIDKIGFTRAIDAEAFVDTPSKAGAGGFKLRGAGKERRPFPRVA